MEIDELFELRFGQYQLVLRRGQETIRIRELGGKEQAIGPRQCHRLCNLRSVEEPMQTLPVRWAPGFLSSSICAERHALLLLPHITAVLTDLSTQIAILAFLWVPYRTGGGRAERFSVGTV